MSTPETTPPEKTPPEKTPNEPTPDRASPATDLPAPDELSVYTFVTQYGATTLPFKLALVVCGLVFAHIAAMVYYHEVAIAKFYDDPDRVRWFMVEMWDLDTEASFGTFYSALALLFIGRLLWHHAKHVKRAGEVWCWWWFVLAVGFHWLSLDEIMAGHEVLNEHKSQVALAQGTDRVRWTVDGLWVAGVVGLAFIPFLMHLGTRFATFCIVGGLVYLGGALGVEQATDKYQDWDMLGTTEYLMWVALEEGMEMIGPVIFLAGFLHYVANARSRPEQVAAPFQ